jgi:Phage-related minor tail protein
MRDLKLRYFIELVSNIERKAKGDAQALEAAQSKIQSALEKTEIKLGGYERALLRIGNMRGAPMARQAEYFAQIAISAHRAEQAVQKYLTLAGKAQKVGQGVAAGGAAAYFAAGAIVKKPIEFSERLARMSNTSFGERDTAGRIKGKQELSAAIERAVQVGKGSRDDAAEALDKMVSSGAYTPEQAMALLPGLVKSSTATGASAEHLQAIGVKANATMDIPLADMQGLIDEANDAGKGGGFELRDMAKDLPAALAVAKGAGLTGREGFRRVVALLQASVKTSGNNPEAANNAINMLAKINSADTAKDFDKQGIDLPARLAQSNAKGVDSITAFMDLVDEVAGKDKEYVAAKARMKDAKTGAQRDEAMGSVANILEGKAIGKVVQDRQALMALVAAMNSREYMDTIVAKMRTADGSTGKDFAVMEQESATKRTEKDNAIAFAGDRAYDKAKPLMDGLYDGVSGAAKEFPVLTTAVVGASAALGVLSATALAGSIAGSGGLAGTVGGAVSRSAGWLAGLFGAARAGLGFGGAATAGAATAGGSAGLLGSAGRMLGGAAKSLGPLAALFAPEGISDDEIMRLRIYEAQQGGDARSGGRITPQQMELRSGLVGAQYVAPRLTAQQMERQLAAPGGGRNDYLSLSAPNMPAQGLAAGSKTEIKVGEGKLQIDVRVSQDGAVSATPTVTQQPALIKLSGGSTNPGSVR